MSEEKLTFEKALKVYDYIRNHPNENRNHILKSTKEMGVSDIQFNKAEDMLYDMGLIDEVKIPSGVGYVADLEIMSPEGILKEHFETLSKIASEK